MPLPAAHNSRAGAATAFRTHAACRVAYKLDGQYQRFDALVGLDEVAARLGRAKVALELDGKRIVLHDGKELTVKDAPQVERDSSVRIFATLCSNAATP